MNEQHAFERIVADSVTSIGQLAPSRGAIDRTVARAGRTRQRPRWLAIVAVPPMRRSSRLVVGSPTVRVLAITVATVLMAVAIAAAGVAGVRLFADTEPAPLGNGPIIVNGMAYDPVTGEIGPDPCNCTTDPSWSADGRRVAFRRWTRILVADLVEKTERELAVCVGCDRDRISMAADGGSVAFTDAGDVWLVDVATGVRTQVTDLGEGRWARHPTLAPGADRVAFEIDDEPGIWVAHVSGGDPWRLAIDGEGAAPRDPAWSPDGRTIAFIRDPFTDLELWTVDIATGEPARIWGSPGCCFSYGPPTWSPDGRELALVALASGQAGRRGGENKALWVVAADGSTARELGGAEPVRPAWRPIPLAAAASPPAERATVPSGPRPISARAARSRPTRHASRASQFEVP